MPSVPAPRSSLRDCSPRYSLALGAVKGLEQIGFVHHGAAWPMTTSLCERRERLRDARIYPAAKPRLSVQSEGTRDLAAKPPPPSPLLSSPPFHIRWRLACR